MWKNKNFRLSVILVVLIIITGIQLLRKGGSGYSGINTELFTITDTLDIQTIRLVTEKEDLELINRDESWYVGSERADEYYVSLLKAVLASVKVQRKITTTESAEVGLRMESGAKVSIKFLSGEERDFIVGGNENQTRSYFKDTETGETYVVNIPGYQSFVAGIFFLSGLEWKDKTLFRTPWTAITDLSIRYPNHPEWDFSIKPGERLLVIDGMQVADTTTLMDYAMIFSDLKANFFFDGSGLDSLTDEQIFMEIEIRDLDESRNNRIKIFELASGNTIQFGIDSNGQYFGFDYRNVNLLAMKKEDFLIED